MRVLKWSVPVDDRPHMIGSGKVVLVACQYEPSVVKVWTEEVNEGDDIFMTAVRVYGTGHPIPTGARHVGSTLAADNQLVWHVYEVNGSKE